MIPYGRQCIDDDDISAAIAVLKSDWLTTGPKVEEFEQAIADYVGAKFAVAVTNGTAALHAAMYALGISPGDEVIVPPMTFAATANCVVYQGGTPVFVDVCSDTLLIDVEKIEEKITAKTRAVIPVHLYGQPAAIDRIKAICDRHHLLMIEDCAQSHFAAFDGRKTGTFGLAGTFSFYPGKNLGAYGDGGAIITNDSDFARRARLFANHGSEKKYIHEIEGINSRLDGLQAAILNVKLKYIEGWNQARYQHALKFNELLQDIPEVKCPKLRPNSSHIFHIYCLRVKDRENLIDYLKAQGIATNIHYPIALPYLPAYSYLKHQPEDFPVAYKYQNEILSLPMYPELTDEQIIFISDSIHKFYSRQV